MADTPHPDMILHRGRFTTLDPARPSASAVAISGGRFTHVGNDHDIMAAVKVWCRHPDEVLAQLATDLVQRRNLHVRLSPTAWDMERIADLRRRVSDHLGIGLEEAAHFVLTGSIVNNAYDQEQDMIELLYKDGSLRDIAEASDNLGIAALASPVEKHYLAWPRWMQDVKI